MTLLKSIFKKNSASTATTDRTRLTADTLKQLFPIRNLSEEILTSFAATHQVEILPAGTTLFEHDQPIDCVLYLISGSLTVSDASGKSFDINPDNPKSKFPLSTGIKHSTTAIAKTDIGVLRASLKIMASSSRTAAGELSIPAHLQSNRLLTLFAEHFHDHELTIPSLPKVAIELRKAIQKDIGIADAVNIIQLDPSITAKLLEVANCPLYLTRFPARNCLDAVSRIGLTATCNLVMALSTKQLFKSESRLLNHYLEVQWKNSLHLSMLSQVLAASSKQVPPEEALLAGLIADIGALPFLSFVANLPEEYVNQTEIDQAIPVIKSVVGAAVLDEWGFAPEFVDVALNSTNWFQNNSDSLSLTDIVVLSRLHALIGKKTTTDIPGISSIPAASKLKHLELSPENSLAILHQAKTNIQAALSLFSS